MSMVKSLKSWGDDLITELKNPEFAQGYLRAVEKDLVKRGKKKVLAKAKRYVRIAKSANPR